MEKSPAFAKAGFLAVYSTIFACFLRQVDAGWQIDDKTVKSSLYTCPV